MIVFIALHKFALRNRTSGMNCLFIFPAMNALFPLLGFLFAIYSSGVRMWYKSYTFR